ncbi:cuticle protein 16.8 [Nephila pilipes]|uniref:Cuticle protein 16.8 n=1 Tax=Nephila pilipes TaxID=299642 RepID=A0A8X6P3F6_NEPPI|nr:cuticle protein 16.8 [Nephila pilipes]
MFRSISVKLFSFCVLSILLNLVRTQRVLEPAPLIQPVVQPPRPYTFGFQFGDGLGMTQYRRESADGAGMVKGSYGYVDPLGVTRSVEYNAGADGYRAVIKSNEPGLTNQASADAVYIVQPSPPAVVAQGLRRPFRIVAVPLK